MGGGLDDEHSCGSSQTCGFREPPCHEEGLASGSGDKVLGFWASAKSATPYT